MKRTLLKVLFSVALIAACDDKPTPPPPPPPPPPPVEKPRVDKAFSLANYQGYIFFGAHSECQSDEEFENNVKAMLAQGWNTPQICSETEFWDPGCGHLPAKKRNPERLKKTLDILARIPGVQVALVGNCTLKRQVPLEEQFQWAQKVAQVAKEYKNVAIFTHNEFDNCAGRNDWGGDRKWCAGKVEVARHISMYKTHGFGIVTADDSFTKDPERTKPFTESQVFSHRLTNIGAWPASFHPDRERLGKPWDPSLSDLQKLARYNGEFILSETVAWQDYSGRCNGLRTCDAKRIDDYIFNCSAIPKCYFTLHSENLLDGKLPTRIPLAR